MFWNRSKKVPSPTYPARPMVDPSAPPNPTDGELLVRLYHEIGMRAPELAREAIAGDRMLFGRHTGWVVTLLDLHEAAPTHRDIGWTLKAKKGRPTVVDCVTGFGDDPAAMAAQLWIRTSGACFLEMATGSKGRFAETLHREGCAPGVPGWHTISSNIVYYGEQPDEFEALSDALRDAAILGRADVTGLLDPAGPSGIKVFVNRTPDQLTAEVSVNGTRADDASGLLAAHPWPEVTGSATARFSAVAVRPLQAV
ncbi:DUF6348 family protein [Actinoplanes sp. NPDC049118]|uniref:DUF6348 family protein n=1 Tax=Actinoplanes sp. NPDC049118 TaxID=3155769 RepID=UPI0033D16EBF